MAPEPSPLPVLESRFESLDFFRGLTMFLLVAESTALYEHLAGPELEGAWIYQLGLQFHHHPWNGLRFWDLIQPFFMFIVGVAIPFAVANRKKRGQPGAQITKHVLQRSLLLLLFGWGLYCMGPGHIVFRFQNVLAQLSVTYLLAYLIMEKPAWVQIAFSLALIAVSEVIYRTFPVEGFNHPFTPNENFGTWLDLQYGGADLNGHWVSFNAIPSAAHTIWGVLAGQLLRSGRSSPRKLQLLLLAGALALAAGYALSPLTPIIKRICTSSFILASGGWTLLALAFSFWLIDMKKWDRGVEFFTVVGMNSLFIYLFAQVGGAGLLERMVAPFTTSLLAWAGEAFVNITTSLAVLALAWYLCYWLYEKRIFFRI